MFTIRENENGCKEQGCCRVEWWFIFRAIATVSLEQMENLGNILTICYPSCICTILTSSFGIIFLVQYIIRLVAPTVMCEHRLNHITMQNGWHAMPTSPGCVPRPLSGLYYLAHQGRWFFLYIMVCTNFLLGLINLKRVDKDAKCELEAWGWFIRKVQNFRNPKNI